MQIAERSAQIWSVLVLAARNRQILTYDLLGRLIGAPAPALGRWLEPIQSYCLIHQMPALTAIVVSDVTGLPGTGFIAAAEVPAEQAKVFRHDWLAQMAPKPEELAAAAAERPSNGLPPE